MNTVQRLVAGRPFGLFVRLLLTLVFWSSGVEKLLFFSQTLAEMRHFGLEPPALFAVLVIAMQLGGSALVIHGRQVWLGVAILAIFTLATIPIAHAFWNLSGHQAFIERMWVMEHLSLLGGLLAVALLPRPSRN